MLNLPEVTLVVVETRCHELMRLTLTDIVLKVQFGGVLIYTDRPELIGIPVPATYIQVPNWPDKTRQGAFYYMEAAHAITTSHALLMEWDGGLRDVSMWRDDFLNYDYIGAPWVGQRDSMTVGNGGFMLLSKRMADYVYDHRASFGIVTDMQYARTNRRRLENEIGAKWAPEDVATQFSYEHYPPTRPRALAGPSFGYHDIFNWPLALDHAEVIRRTRLVIDNIYVVTRTSKLGLLARSWPWVRAEIGELEFDAAVRHHHPRARPQIRSRQPRVLAIRDAIRGKGVKA